MCTEMVAIQAAQAFCRKVGEPLAASAAASLSALEPQKGAAEPWAGCWRVVLRDDAGHVQAEVELVDQTQIICYFSNRRSFDPDPAAPGGAGRRLAKDTAIARAQAVLEASGGTAELAYRWGGAGRRRYRVRLPVDLAGTVVPRLPRRPVPRPGDPGGGRCSHRQAPAASPAPFSTPLPIARRPRQRSGPSTPPRRAGSAGVQARAPYSAHLEVVQPTSFWRAPGARELPGRTARVAWNCRFLASDPSGRDGRPRKCGWTGRPAL